ncbi:hypothetical protein HK097_010030 [Rhizophlyctis rosea]|uniref:Protein root UVB sensitive/RUS domain-containing protein n=1 Tax=Rhizophlyctis rosea TaxID=64517 RepID=A0AAD5SJ48_9FUNG|nr:hypothetical protein HK097_010030 [Rhizophlyctis rosea]
MKEPMHRLNRLTHIRLLPPILRRIAPSFTVAKCLSTNSSQERNNVKASKPHLEVRQRYRKGDSTLWTVIKQSPPTDDIHTTTPKWSVHKHANDIYSSEHPSIAKIGALDPHPTATSQPSRTLPTLLNTIRHTLATGFLPKGYPHSITPDYTPYTLYTLLHSITGTITGTLSTQSLLHALGMGAATSLGLAATTNWIIKDGFGLLGGVIYAGYMGSRFDSSPKRYRFLAALLIQASTLIELLTPLIPHLFVPMASLSNIGKNIGWLASSATKASMHKGFLKEDNLGDVTAKAGAQSTAAGLIGTLGGIALSWGVGTSPSTLFFVFWPLCGLNLWSAYKANQAVITRTINLERGELLFHQILKDSFKSPLPSPTSIAESEHFITPFKSPFGVPIALEPSLARRLEHIPPDFAHAFFTNGYISPKARKEQYRILITTDAKTGVKLNMWYTEPATSKDMLKGFFHACLVRKRLEMEGQVDFERGLQVVRAGYEVAEGRFEELVAGMERVGWDLGHTHLGDRNRRIAVLE